MFNKYPDYFPKFISLTKKNKAFHDGLWLKNQVIEHHSEFIRQLVRSFKFQNLVILLTTLLLSFFQVPLLTFLRFRNRSWHWSEEYAYKSWLAVGFNDKDRLKDILKDLPVWDKKYGDISSEIGINVRDEEILLMRLLKKHGKFWHLISIS